MNVPETEGRLFYRLFVGCLKVANRRHRILAPFHGEEDFFTRPADHRVALRNALYTDPECFDVFLREGDLSGVPDAAEIVTSWRDHRVAGSFFVLRHLERHTIFLATDGPTRAFGVLGLASPLEEMIPRPPAVVDTVLLPLRGRIIYDGIFHTHGADVVVGAGIRRDLEDLYRSAKAREGVITSLPIEPDPAPGEVGEKALRRLEKLLRTKGSRERSWDLIQSLRERSPELEAAYHHALGKALAPEVRRTLRAAGVERGWFALLDGVLIASGPSKAALRERLHEILPASRCHLPYLFRLKARAAGGDA